MSQASTATGSDNYREKLSSLSKERVAKAHSLCATQLSIGRQKYLIQLQDASCSPHLHSMRASYPSCSASPGAVHSSENAHSTILRVLLSTTHTILFSTKSLHTFESGSSQLSKNLHYFKGWHYLSLLSPMVLSHYASLLPCFIFTVPQGDTARLLILAGLVTHVMHSQVLQQWELT